MKVFHSTPLCAELFHGAAQVLRAQGDLDGALKHYRRAQTIYENTLGKDHPHLAAVIDRIGGVWSGTTGVCLPCMADGCVTGVGESR